MLLELISKRLVRKQSLQILTNEEESVGLRSLKR